jgi:hypothetical protein
MSRSLRIAAVTAGLLVAGAVAGAVAADVALLIALAVGGTPVALNHVGEPLLFVGAVGALFGGVLLPVTAWIFLRRVPLGLALLGTLLGTILGGVGGWVLSRAGDPVQGGVVGAVIGFALAALLLRLRASAPARHAVSVR